jgi:hypothetical protein
MMVCWRESSYALLPLGAYIRGDTVRFEVLTATIMKMAVFWDVAPCSLVDTD